MGWTLRLVETGKKPRSRRKDVFEFGDIGAPCDLDTVGLTITQAKDVLAALQQRIVMLQAEALATKARAAVRSTPHLHLKGYRVRQLDTLFGRIALKLPRLVSGDPECEPPCLVIARKYARSTLEYDRVRASLSAWMSYRVATNLLSTLLPVDNGAHVATLHRRVQAMGKSLIDAPPQPQCDLPGVSEISLAIDTTYIRSDRRSSERQWEILIGAAESDTGERRFFGAPIQDDTASLRVTQQALTDVGRTAETRLTAFTDGAGNMRRLAAQVGVPGPPILDWFHIAMKIRHLQVAAHALPIRVPSQVVAKAAVCEHVERVRWKLWNGNVDAMRGAAKQLPDALARYRYERRNRFRPAPSRAVRSAAFALQQYISGQEAWTANYAERHRSGQRVGTSLAEGMAENLVNRRMNKSQHMRWSRDGALYLLQIRAAILNDNFKAVALAA